MNMLRKTLCWLALAGFLLLLIISLNGCAHSERGLAREDFAYQASTNTAAFVERYITPFVPAPYNGLVPLVMGAVGAALGAWSLSQEKRLKALRAAAPKT
jgi:hypothetical protein